MTVKPKLVPLFSNWYSGATLFTILLNANSQIVSNGESMFFSEDDNKRYDCSCGRYIDECEFYAATTAPMRLAGGAGWDKQLFVQVPGFSRNPLLRTLLHSPRLESALRHKLIDVIPAYRTVRERFLEAQLQFFANARRLSGASIYLDGTKSIRRAQLFARDGRSDMKVLHLVRDGRGFCASYVKNKRPVPTWPDAAETWVRYIAQVDQFARDFPGVPVMVVKYEELCRSTAEVMRAICQFLEIPYEEPRAESKKDTHILGNRMRRTFNGVIVEDSSWREKLDPRMQKDLTSRMRRQLKQFGYL